MPKNDRQAHSLIVDSVNRTTYNNARNVTPTTQGGISVRTILVIAFIAPALIAACIKAFA